MVNLPNHSGRAEGNLLRSLDRRLGIPAESEAEAVAAYEAFAAATPPMPVDVEGVLACVRVAATVAAPPPAIPHPRSPSPWRVGWRGRTRRILLISLTGVVLAAGAVPVVLRWSGRNSRASLPYEQAIETMFDEGTREGSRAVAMGLVKERLVQLVKLFHALAWQSDDVGLRDAARRGLAELDRELREDRAHELKRGTLSYGAFAYRLEQLADERLPSHERHLLIEELTLDGRHGIDALERTRQVPGRFEREGPILLRRVAKRIADAIERPPSPPTAPVPTDREGER